MDSLLSRDMGPAAQCPAAGARSPGSLPGLRGVGVFGREAERAGEKQHRRTRVNGFTALVFFLE